MTLVHIHLHIQTHIQTHIHPDPPDIVSPPADTPQCIGQQYAYMHLAATLGTASVLMDWQHARTKDSDEIQVVAA